MKHGFFWIYWKYIKLTYKDTKEKVKDFLRIVGREFNDKRGEFDSLRLKYFIFHIFIIIVGLGMFLIGLVGDKGLIFSGVGIIMYIYGHRMILCSDTIMKKIDTLRDEKDKR